MNKERGSLYYAPMSCADQEAYAVWPIVMNAPLYAYSISQNTDGILDVETR